MHYNVQGRVQGVGFRQFCCQTARHLQLSGYVRNLADGSVECQATGDSEQLLCFEQALWEGNSYSRTDSVTKRLVTASATGSFVISY